MAASNLVTESSNLFGTGKLKTYDLQPSQILLPKPKSVDPYLLARSRTADTVEGYDTGTGEAEVTGSDDSFVDNSPITKINDAIVMPEVGDKESLNTIPEFANLTEKQLMALGLLGMTPKSLTATFNNLRRVGDIDLAGMGLQALQNLSPPVAAAISIVTGNTLNTLQNAINNPHIIGTPATAFRALALYDTVSKLNWEDVQSIPERAFSAVQDVLEGFAQIANDPVGSAQAFLNMAGNYAEFGTSAPKINTVQFGNETYNFVTDNRGQVITAPGFIKQLTQGPLSSGVYVAQGLADLAGRFLPGPGQTIQERAQDDFEMAMAAQNGPAREIAPGMTIHSTPTTSFLHVENFEVPGIGTVTQAFNLDRLTAKYGPLELNYGIVEAALQNSMAMYSMEDQERIAEAINQQLGIKWGPNLTAAVETVRQEAAVEQTLYERHFGEGMDAHNDPVGLREAIARTQREVTGGTTTPMIYGVKDETLRELQAAMDLPIDIDRAGHFWTEDAIQARRDAFSKFYEWGFGYINKDGIPSVSSYYSRYVNNLDSERSKEYYFRNRHRYSTGNPSLRKTGLPTVGRDYKDLSAAERKYIDNEINLQEMELTGPDIGHAGIPASRKTFLKNAALSPAERAFHARRSLTKEEVNSFTESAVDGITGYDGDGYNSANPGDNALDAYNFVTGITGKFTYGNTQQDRDLTKIFLGLEPWTKYMGDAPEGGGEKLLTTREPPTAIKPLPPLPSKARALAPEPALPPPSSSASVPTLSRERGDESRYTFPPGYKEPPDPPPADDESRYTFPPGYKEPPDPLPNDLQLTVPPGYKEPPQGKLPPKVSSLEEDEIGQYTITADPLSGMVEDVPTPEKSIANRLTGPPSSAKTAAETRSNLGQKVRDAAYRDLLGQAKDWEEGDTIVTSPKTTKTIESPAEDAAAITKRGKEDESKLYQTTEELSIQSDKQAFAAAGGKRALNAASGKVERALLNVQAAKPQKDWSDANKENYAKLTAQLAAARQNLMDLSFYSYETGAEDWGGTMSTAADGAAGFGMGRY